MDLFRLLALKSFDRLRNKAYILYVLIAALFLVTTGNLVLPWIHKFLSSSNCTLSLEREDLAEICRILAPLNLRATLKLGEKNEFLDSISLTGNSTHLVVSTVECPPLLSRRMNETL